MLKVQLLFVLVSLLILIIILELVRKRRLREGYSLLWIFVGLGILILNTFPKILFFISEILHLYYLTTMSLISFLFLLAIILNNSVTISGISETNENLTRSIGMLEFKIRQLEGDLNQLRSEKKYNEK